MSTGTTVHTPWPRFIPAVCEFLMHPRTLIIIATIDKLVLYATAPRCPFQAWYILRTLIK